MQTNLVYTLTDKKREFFKDVLFEDGFGTSWDYDIRFGSTAAGKSSYLMTKKTQSDLWEENVKKLTFEDGHYMTMIVSMTKKLLEEVEPKDIIEYAHSLGFKHILFERITSDGNAPMNPHIFPGNKLQDEWMLKMWNQTLEYKLYEKIGNMLLSEFAEAIVNQNHTANRCRVCEKTLLTINADGTIAGCPNTAPSEYWGNINWTIHDNLHAKKRLKTISCEMTRNPVCYTCPAYSICNGDCHQLAWEGDLCAAPKSIWQKCLKEKDMESYKKLILP
jgi:radical SAM protein with 4Fe4S-binding SPASM domain